MSIKNNTQSFLDDHDDLVEVTISDMLQDEICYTLPWAVFACEDGAVWINGNYSFTSTPEGNSQTRIERKGDMIHVTKATLGDSKLSASPSSWCNASHKMAVVLD